VFTSGMDLSMAPQTQRNEVGLGIASALAAKFLVMDFQVRHRSTGLASPSVASQYLLPQSFIRAAIEPQAWIFRPQFAHAASSLFKVFIKASFCSAGN